MTHIWTWVYPGCPRAQSPTGADHQDRPGLGSADCTHLFSFCFSCVFEPAYILEHYQFVLKGALVTIGVSVVSILIATVLALLVR